jgi:hypothetical protein
MDTMNALKGLGFAASILAFALVAYGILAAPGLLSDQSATVPPRILVIAR